MLKCWLKLSERAIGKIRIIKKKTNQNLLSQTIGNLEMFHETKI